MFTLRCTRKFLKRLGVRPTSEAVAPSTVLGDWYANLLYTRPQQLVLAMNERSLLCVLVPAAPFSQIGSRLRDAVSGLLLDIGAPEASVAAEAAAMESMMISATASQRVLGCMRDAVVQLQSCPRGPANDLLLRDAELYLADNIYSLTNFEPPALKALELFGTTVEVGRPRRRPWLH